MNRSLWFVGIIGSGWIASAAPPPTSAPAAIELSQRAGDAAIQALIDMAFDQLTASRRKLSTELAGAGEADRALREFIASTASFGAAETGSQTIRRRVTIPTGKVNTFLADLATRDPYRLNARSLQLPKQPPELTAYGVLNLNDGPFDDHPGWRHCRRENVAIARRAAGEDLRARLINLLAELPTTHTTILGEILGENAEARRAVRAAIDRLPLPEATLEPSGVCRLRMVLPKRQVLALLHSALDNPPGEKPTVDWQRVESKLVGTMSIEGFAVAPAVREFRPETRPTAN